MIPGDTETGNVSTLEARGQAKSQPSPSAREDLKALPMPHASDRHGENPSNIPMGLEDPAST